MPVLVEGRVELSQTGRASVIADRVVFGPSTDKPKPAKPGSGQQQARRTAARIAEESKIAAAKAAKAR